MKERTTESSQQGPGRLRVQSIASQDHSTLVWVNCKPSRPGAEGARDLVPARNCVSVGPPFAAGNLVGPGCSGRREAVFMLIGA